MDYYSPPQQGNGCKLPELVLRLVAVCPAALRYTFVHIPDNIN